MKEITNIIALWVPLGLFMQNGIIPADFLCSLPSGREVLSRKFDMRAKMVSPALCAGMVAYLPENLDAFEKQISFGSIGRHGRYQRS